MSETPPVVQFGQRELDPDQEAEYAKKIAASRERLPTKLDGLKGSTPLGHVPRPAMPDLAVARTIPSEDMRAGQRETPSMGGAEMAAGLKQLGDAVKGQPKEAPKPDEKKAVPEKDDRSLLELLDGLESAAGPRNESERILNNKKRKEAIEKRCQPLDFQDLLMKNFVTQSVPIMPGKFEPTFRSITMEEELFAKNFMASENGNESFLTSKYTLVQLACGLLAINDSPMVDHLDRVTGQVNKEEFKKKLIQLQRMSVYLIADLMTNYFWFDLRVRRLMASDELGNG